MNKIPFSNRLKEIMDMKNLKQIDVLNLCEPYCKKYNIKVTKANMSQWLSGHCEPKNRKLAILGMALNVSEVWLMGYDVPMEKEAEKEDPIELGMNIAELLKDEEAAMIIEEYLNMNDKEKEMLKSYIEFIKSKRKGNDQ